MRRLFDRPIVLLNTANGTALAAGIALSIVAHDAHGMMRTGAFLAAVTGLFVVWQVREEIEMELRKANEHAIDHPPALAPLEVKARQLENKRHERREGALRKARLAMVLAIAAWLFIGEILHGFGDILYHSVEYTLAGLESNAPDAAEPKPIGQSTTVGTRH